MKDDLSNGRMVLSLRNVCKSFGGLKATNQVSLDMEAGNIHCLIGPNGAGKSTIFRLIAGHYRPDSGQIFFNDRKITKLSSYQRARLGISIKFQTPGVYYDMTVWENMMIPLLRRFHKKEVKEEVAKKLAQLNLTELADVETHKISHGQRQWLEIGMALSLSPKLLLLDEPTAGMSPEETAKTVAIIQGLNKEGVTVVAIEHDMNFVRDLNPRVTVLHLGKVFAVGALQEVEADERVREIYLGRKKGEESAC